MSVAVETYIIKPNCRLTLMTVLRKAALICFHRRVNSGTTSTSFLVLAQTLHSLPMVVEGRHFKHMKVIIHIFYVLGIDEVILKEKERRKTCTEVTKVIRQTSETCKLKPTTIPLIN
jgi:hypothetical protein